MLYRGSEDGERTDQDTVGDMAKTGQLHWRCVLSLIDSDGAPDTLWMAGYTVHASMYQVDITLIAVACRDHRDTNRQRRKWPGKYV